MPVAKHKQITNHPSPFGLKRFFSIPGSNTNSGATDTGAMVFTKGCVAWNKGKKVKARMQAKSPKQQDVEEIYAVSPVEGAMLSALDLGSAS